MEYRIYLVPNGSRNAFFGGYGIKGSSTAKPFADGNCRVWWQCDTEEEVLKKFRELAEEEANKETHVDDTDEQIQKFIDDCVKSRSIEWDCDLKWLHVAKCDDDGNILEVL